MKHTPDIESWLSLNLIDGVGGESIRRLLVAFGNPAAVLSAQTGALERIVKPSIAKRIKQRAATDKINQALKWLADPINAIITFADADYPVQLLHIADPPPLLYFKGRRELLRHPALAVVGSRNATPRGWLMPKLLLKPPAMPVSASSAAWPLALTLLPMKEV